MLKLIGEHLPFLPVFGAILKAKKAIFQQQYEAGWLSAYKEELWLRQEFVTLVTKWGQRDKSFHVQTLV